MSVDFVVFKIMEPFMFVRPTTHRCHHWNSVILRAVRSLPFGIRRFACDFVLIRIAKLRQSNAFGTAAAPLALFVFQGRVCACFAPIFLTYEIFCGITLFEKLFFTKFLVLFCYQK